LLDQETKYGEAGHAIDDNVAHAHCMVKNTYSEYLIVTCFQQELQLDEGVAISNFTNTALLFVKLALCRENM